MDFLNIDIEDITITKCNNYFNIESNGKPIKIKTPKLYIPFGLEERYKNYYLNLEFDDLKNDNYQNSFLLF